MKNERIHSIAAGVETAIFIWLGILLVGIVTSNITRFFVVHRLKPFIAGAGVVFLLWGMQNLKQVRAAQHHDAEYFFHMAAFFILVFIVSIPVFQYMKPGIPQSGAVGITASGGISTLRQFNSQIQPYPDGQLQAGESQQDSDLFPAAGSDVSYSGAVLHAFTASSARPLSGYYPGKKLIVIGDTDGAGWVKEIENQTSSYIGWSVTMKGCVVTDPSVFGPGMFCPARELMTCCVADLSLIGFTCLYDTDGPFAGLIQDGSWVTVTGILQQGEYQGRPEVQLVCTSVESASPPADLYLYP